MLTRKGVQSGSKMTVRTEITTGVFDPRTYKVIHEFSNN